MGHALLVITFAVSAALAALCLYLLPSAYRTVKNPHLHPDASHYAQSGRLDVHEVNMIETFAVLAVCELVFLAVALVSGWSLFF